MLLNPSVCHTSNTGATLRSAKLSPSASREDRAQRATLGATQRREQQPPRSSAAVQPAFSSHPASRLAVPALPTSHRPRRANTSLQPSLARGDLDFLRFQLKTSRAPDPTLLLFCLHSGVAHRPQPTPRSTSTRCCAAQPGPPLSLVTESQNHRIVGVGRDLCGSSSPTPLPKQGHLQ